MSAARNVRRGVDRRRIAATLFGLIALTCLFSPRLLAQQGAVQLQQLQQRFARARLDLQRRRAPDTGAQRRLDQLHRNDNANGCCKSGNGGRRRRSSGAPAT